MCDLINLSLGDQRKPKNQSKPLKKLLNLNGKSFKINSIVEIDQDRYTLFFKNILADYSFEIVSTFSIQILTVKIQILQSNGNLLKIGSSYLRNYLNRYFIKEKPQFAIKVHPINGQIHFQFSIFVPQTCKCHNQYVIQLISKHFQDIQNKIQIMIKLTKKKQDEYSLNDQKQARNFKLLKIIQNAREDQNNILKQLCFYNDQKKNTTSQFQQTIQLMNYQQLQQEEKSSIHQLKKKISNLLQKYLQPLQISGIKKGGSNLEQLLINQKQHFKLYQKIKEIQQNKKLKNTIQINNLKQGNNFINLIKQTQSSYSGKKQFLQSIPKGCEYTFIDKFYKLQGEKQSKVLLSLALKQQMLDKFLKSNINSITFQTKLRIFVQIANSISILWAKQKYILSNFWLNSISVTKNLTIKLKNFHLFFRVQKHILLQNKQLVNLKRLESFLTLAKLYFNLFYQQQLVYFRPSRQKSLQKSFVKCQEKYKIFDRQLFENIRQNCFLYGPAKAMTSMNYIFLSYTKIKIKNQNKKAKLQTFYKHSQIEEETVQINQSILSSKYIVCWFAKLLDQASPF